MSFASLSRILRCANNNDILTLKAEDSADNITFIIESLSGEKVSEYEMKLIDIDSENLGIPDQDYDAIVKLPSNELQRICRDLSQLSDSSEFSFKYKCITIHHCGMVRVICRSVQ